LVDVKNTSSADVGVAIPVESPPSVSAQTFASPQLAFAAGFQYLFAMFYVSFKIHYLFNSNFAKSILFLSEITIRLSGKIKL